MGRVGFVGGNWKMNGTEFFAMELFKEFEKENLNPKEVDIIIAPPAILLKFINENKPKGWQVSAQNCFYESMGAYTGEISVPMLKDCGVGWTILGHSERRHLFNEDVIMIRKKLKHCISNGIKVIFCVGETLDVRKENLTERIIFEQLESVLDLNEENLINGDVVIAYEPVWAIGTGMTATPEDANNVHMKIRSWISKHFSQLTAESMRIIYGGSVKPSNSSELFNMEHIDGFLVGGCSLSKDFTKIIASISKQ